MRHGAQPWTACAKGVEASMQPKGRKCRKRNTATLGKRFNVQVGSVGLTTEAAVREMVDLGKGQAVGRWLGAVAVMKAERR